MSLAKAKNQTYALHHCLSTDTALGAGVAFTSNDHFAGLRGRVGNESHVNVTLLPISSKKTAVGHSALSQDASTLIKPPGQISMTAWSKCYNVRLPTRSWKFTSPAQPKRWSGPLELVVFYNRPFRITLYTPHHLSIQKSSKSSKAGPSDSSEPSCAESAKESKRYVEWRFRAPWSIGPQVVWGEN